MPEKLESSSMLWVELVNDFEFSACSKDSQWSDALVGWTQLEPRASLPPFLLQLVPQLKLQEFLEQQ